MAQLVLGVVGAYIGGSVGGAWGARIGWAVGAYIGGRIDAPEPERPKLLDTQTGGVQYGTPIPKTWGNVRVTGSPIYQSDLIATEVSEDAKGGKGGPVRYQYSVNCAILIREGLPRGQVGRIWMNGRLVFGREGPDLVDDGDAPSIVGNFIDEAILPLGSFEFFSGADDQPVSAMLEADLGVGEVSAYRGTMYMTIEGLDLTCFGNRLPTISFEIVEDVEFVPATTRAEVVPEWTTDNGISTSGALYEVHGQPDRFISAKPGLYNTAGVVSLQRGNPIPVDEITYQGQGYTATNPRVPNTFYMNGGTFGIWRYEVNLAGEMQGVLYTDTYHQLTGIWASENGTSVYSHALAVGLGWGKIERFTANLEPTGEVLYPPGSIAPGNIRSLTNSESYSWGLFGTINDAETSIGRYSWGGGTWTVFNLPGMTAQTINYDPATNLLFLRGGSTDADKSFVVDATTGELVRTITIPGGLSHADSFQPRRSSGTGEYFMEVTDNTIAAINPSTGSVRLFPLNTLLAGDNSIEPVDGWEILGTANILPQDNGCFYAVDGPYQIGQGGAPYFPSTTLHLGEYCVGNQGVLERATVPLSKIVSDLCIESGLPATDFDVTELTDEVRGFVKPKPMAARTAIESLIKGFPFTGFESEFKIKWRQNQRPGFTVIDEFYLVDDGDESLIQTIRNPDLELPREVVFGYFDQEQDHEIGVQRARREQSSVLGIVRNEATIVFRSGEANTAAHRNLYWAWLTRDSFRLRTSMKYWAQEPTDVIQLPISETLRPLVRIEKWGIVGNMLEFECTRYDDSVYGQFVLPGASANPSGGGESGTGGDPELPVVNNASGALLDIPLVRDSDSNSEPITYWASQRPGINLSEVWGGSQLLKSSDGGASFQSVDAVNTEGAIGTAVGTLGDHTLGNVRDVTNSLQVQFPRDDVSFDTVTLAGLLNGRNFFFYDGELAQFQTAVKNGPGLWTFSDLLRGRRGTDQSIANHAADQKFIFLGPSKSDTTVQTVGEIGVQRDYKFAPNGTDPASAEALDFTLQGNSLRPYSPVCVKVTPNGGDWDITWVRRTRTDGAWRDNVDAGLGETSEQYEIDIYDSAFANAPVATYTSSTPTLTYTAAQATADFGSLPANVAAVVYQMSASVGRGFPRASDDTFIPTGSGGTDPDNNTNTGEVDPPDSGTGGIDPGDPVAGSGAASPVERAILMASTPNQDTLVGVPTTIGWNNPANAIHAGVVHGASNLFSNVAAWAETWVAAVHPTFVTLPWHDCLPWVVWFDGPGHTACNIFMGNLHFFIRNRFTKQWTRLYHGPLSRGQYADKQYLIADQGAMDWVNDYQIAVPGPGSLTNKCLHPYGKRLYNLDLANSDCLFVCQKMWSDGGNMLVHIGSDAYPVGQQNVQRLPGQMLSAAHPITSTPQWFSMFCSSESRADYDDSDGTVITPDELRLYPPTVTDD